MTTIIPKFKVILTYDIQPGKQSEYSQFVLGKFIPGVQALNLYIMGVYHTIHGDYPARQAEFVTDSWDAMVDALNSDEFGALEGVLKGFTLNYHRKVVRYRKGFQL
jgi:hypothetical protein